MATKEDYEPLSAGIQQRGGFTTLRYDDTGNYDLVCASRSIDGALGGTSFWVWFDSQSCAWFLSTWCPRYYLIPPSADLVQLCSQCLSLDSKAMPRVPDSITAEFGLVEVSEADFHLVYKRDLGGPESPAMGS
jgi:hypothetical protein